MKAIQNVTAKDLMTTAVLPAKADWPVNRLAEFLTENDISGAPVIDEDGKLVGVVSLVDLVRHDSLPETVPWSRALKDHFGNGSEHFQMEYRFADEEMDQLRVDGDTTVTVADIMNPIVYSVDPDAPASAMAETMITGQIHRLIVTSGDGNVEGVVTALDLLKVVRDM